MYFFTMDRNKVRERVIDFVDMLICANHYNSDAEGSVCATIQSKNIYLKILNVSDWKNQCYKIKITIFFFSIQI
jgi:hypothetical protein